MRRALFGFVLSSGLLLGCQVQKDGGPEPTETVDLSGRSGQSEEVVEVDQA